MSEENVNKIGSRRFLSKLQESLDPGSNNVEPFAFTAPTTEDPPEEVKAFAPPSTRLAATQRVTGSSRLQTIGQFVTALTYREAMAMGAGIAAKMKEGNAETLTNAIQDWAWEWETFTEEERPVTKE
jgi:hypothetical protein